MQVEYVILVNNNDQPLGAMEKMEAHEKGMLHRAFSIFIFNSAGKLLMQRRAEEKYHSAGLWTNTVCSHPRTGEKTLDAAHRRLKEEMGIDCDLEEVYAFTYKAHVGDGMTEHEFDHVFIGHSDEIPNPDPEEVSEWKYVDLNWLINDVKEKPDNYTIWFKKILNEAKPHLTKARIQPG